MRTIKVEPALAMKALARGHSGAGRMYGILVCLGLLPFTLGIMRSKE